MHMGLFTRRSLGLGFALAALSCAPASAAVSSAGTVGCSALPVSQPFLSWNDTNWYSQVPGQTDANFVGTGWALSGGARIVSTVRADGRTGTVLELPSGAVAISPTICVTSDYPTARTMVRTVLGSQGLSMSVSYDRVNYQSAGNLGSQGTSWLLSKAFNIKSSPISGSQLVQFKFEANKSTTQIYNFWVDPRMCR